MVKVTFHGAVREVTGSLHEVDTGADKILLDCGMFQGRRKQAEVKNRHLPVDPGQITSVILSHAHIDHSGRLPLLCREAFKGRIVCTRATADACRYLLPDSAHIQESDAAYLNYKMVRAALSGLPKHRLGADPAKIRQALKQNHHRLNEDAICRLAAELGLELVEPLYTVADSQTALGFFDGYPYRHGITVGRDTDCRFYEAGHILGSCMAVVRTRANGRAVTIGYTGDIGRFGKPIIRDPALDLEPEDRQLDLLILESTYGNRDHEAVDNLKPGLEKVIRETVDRGGSVIIPAFAFGRTQELVYLLHQLYDEGRLPRIPVYVDSPLASNITQVFGEHPEVYDREAHDIFLSRGKNPFSFGQIHFIETVEQSMALNREEKPHIVIAASGMCEAGRVLHHLRHKIHNPRHTILIVGFMAQNTLGRRILELGSSWNKAGRKGPAPLVRFLNKDYPLQAHVAKLGGFSAHGDRHEMLRFLKAGGLVPKTIALVHGEQDQSLAFAEFLAAEGYNVMVPRPGQTITLA